MIQGFFNKFFSKSDQPHSFDRVDQDAVLTLKLDEMVIGYLSCKDNEWTFVYSEEFRSQDEYHNIVGFPDLNEEYKSSELWPFFRIRIPGLKQPAVKEIVEKEKIKNNEYELLKRFGRKSISNPYELVC